MIQRKINLPKDISFFLFGPRQTGKTTLIDAVFTQRILKINLLLNQQFLKYSKNPDLLIDEVAWKIKEGALDFIVVDEIQRVPALLNAVQYIIDNYHIPCILTGSSARKLKRGMANLLGGRALQRFLFPFIWDEISADYSLEEVLAYGTLPPVVIARKNQRAEILNAYVETYIREEIHAEGIVRNVGSFSRFLDMAAAQFGEQLNYSEIARECQLPVMTVKTYYEILEDTLIGIILHPYRKSIRKRLSAHPKVYLFDNGVTNAINRYVNEIFDPSLLGRLFEQFLVCETFRRVRYLQSNTQIFYWRTNTGSEVDLVIERNKKIIAAFEIKYSKTVTSTHLSGLRSFLKDNPDVPCYLISRVDEPYSIGTVSVIHWQQYFDILTELLS
jgi:predicted AAA+ superfamily ATPase